VARRRRLILVLLRGMNPPRLAIYTSPTIV
jgi:hypothetical protein